MQAIQGIWRDDPGDSAIQRGAKGKDSQIIALLNDRGFTQWKPVVVFGNPAGLKNLHLVVQALALEEYHRIITTERRGEQPFGAVGRGGKHHFQARHVREQAVERLRMLRGIGESATGAGRDHQRQANGRLKTRLVDR